MSLDAALDAVPDRIYIPVITKAESVDGIVRKLAVIFVAANVERLRPSFNWRFPVGMPPGLKYLLQVARMLFRARWEILEPRFREAKFQTTSTERCSEIARSVIADYEQMRHDAEKEGLRGLDSFNVTFNRELRAEVDAYWEEWTKVIDSMRAKPADNPKELSRQLQDLLGNNAKWLALVGKQFTLTVADFG